MTGTQRYRSRIRLSLSIAIGALSMASAAKFAEAASQLPQIRMTPSNQVPACVTPERLMSFLATRNSAPHPRYAQIAQHYKKLGEGWRVRWDYAFFQMAIETNFLTYKQPNGRWGDVDPKQNNFAGIGTTGGGVPGDSFADIKAGVLGHLQHLVAYSGERVVAPVAPRTQLKQDVIIEASQNLNRPVTFQDLARRWAVDPKYGSSIAWVAEDFRGRYCKGNDKPAASKAIEARADDNGDDLPWAKSKPVPAPQPAAKISTAPKPVPAKKLAAASITPIATAPLVPAVAEPKIVNEPAAATKPVTAVRTVWEKPELAQKATGPQPAATPAVPAPPSLETTSITDTNGSSLAAAATQPLDPAAEAAPAQAQLIPIGTSERPATAPLKTAPPSGLGMNPATGCVIKAASYGGNKTVLIKSTTATGEPLYVALGVLDGFEQSMTTSFLKTQPAGAEVAGQFDTKAGALAQASSLCQTK